RIIELDPDYSVAVVTAGSRDYLWVLSRRPEMAKEELDGIVSRMKTLGFEVDKLEYPRPAKLDPET
ncbi:MAG: lipocalin family protein, partial [Clostridia bacterium]|nr:lipocalin family protein [Clostridia bacterium]